MKGEPKSLTPVMQQFFRAKELYPDAILFFRLGDFYEMFFDDAVEAAALLDIALTSRGTTAGGERIPMAGVPYHAAAGYLARLLSKGRRVAICEQMADPKRTKGIVPREVVRVVTPGLCVEPDALDARAPNYLCAVSAEDGSGPVGLAALELSTGELQACAVADSAAALAELLRLDPREVLLSGPLDGLGPALGRAAPAVPVRVRDAVVDPVAVLSGVVGGEEADRARADLPAAGLAAAALALGYAQGTLPRGELPVERIGRYAPEAHLGLDDAAVRNLELVRTLGGERKGSLLHLLDETRTAMGARLLRRRLLAPLTDVAAIRRRHDAVEALVLDPSLRNELRDALASAGDVERLATRAALGLATPRDLGGLRDGIGAARAIAGLLGARGGATADALAAATPADLCDDVHELLSAALVGEPPAVASGGGIFRDGQSAELDELRVLSSRGKDVVLELERRERERTGIPLKVRFTRVFGYYIEVTRTHLKSVPADWRRKQTVATGERFVTDELADLQERILTADERGQELEAELFVGLRRAVAAQTPRLRALAARLAELDVHAALADVAHRHGYARPEVDRTLGLLLQDARHPIVEQLAEAGTFVPNDVQLDADGERMMIVTGPNMAGKSTVLRQAALAVIMAQAGSFVPARRARIGIVDRVFTRVGASDNLGEGQSTFMVEMREAATILRGATRRSLVVLDELGRGTSTYDGLAIAWAIAEHLHDAVGCRTVFATHYHELCELAGLRTGVVNMNVAAREYGEEVVFLHKLVPGGANRSYGVAVARLAGVPPIVLARARAILADLEQGASREKTEQMELFAAAPSKESEVEKTLRALDVDRLTPLDALVALARLKSMLP